MPTWELIASLDVDALVEAANDVIYKESPPYRHFSDELRAGLKLAQEAIETLLKHLDEAEKKIAAAEKEIKKTEAYLDKKEAELKAGKKAMKEKKAEAEAKIRKGWAEYYSKKNLYEGKLAEAIALLSENREEAEAKLAEAKSEVEEIDGKGLVIDRNSCTSYIDVREQIKAVNSAGLVFGLFFLLVTGLVCFSTITIIIEEQKKLLGTVKAFGFHKREVLGKYLLFGGTAGVIGSILAFLGGIGLCSLVLKASASSNLYQYGEASVVVKYKPFILVATGMLLVCVLSTIIACTDILKSPASMLMKDESLRSNKAKTGKKKDSTNRGSLYSRLILRNMKDDMARVVVSTAIVAVCTCLLGIGFNFRFSFTGMIDKQDKEVYNYDFRINYSSNVTPEQKQQFRSALEQNSAEYTETICESHLFNNYRGVSGLEVIAGNADELPGFIRPTLNGKSVDFSTDGIMLPLRMSEVFKHDVGDDFVIYDSEMNERTAPVTELYHNYFGRQVLMSKETYESMFGKRFEPNSVYVRVKEGADVEALKASLLNISEEISFADVDSYKNGIESIQSLYDIIVYVLLGIAILMSFLILTNLANIFLKRKKTELSVMRVNGFSVKQAKGYLAKESVLTTVIGLVVGVIMGTPLSMVAIRLLEPTEMQFDRSYHVLAWVLAVAIEGIFAFIVYRTTFRKVKNLNLRDIAD